MAVFVFVCHVRRKDISLLFTLLFFLVDVGMSEYREEALICFFYVSPCFCVSWTVFLSVVVLLLL